MISNAIQFCVRERTVVSVLLIVLLAIGIDSTKKVPIDAIPNIGQNQVIVLSNWMGRSPKDVEDQVTYPLSISLLSVPGAESVRGKSLFGYSFVQVTFRDDVDFYWARSRVAEQLTTIASSLPEGVSPQLGPDATGLGQIYYYVLKPDKPMDLAALRSLQDYVVKYSLQAVDGVSEVSSIGGYVRQYQVDIDPDRLRFHDIPLQKLVSSLKSANAEVGAKTLEQSGMEFIIRGKGYLGDGKGPAHVIKDLEDAVVESRSGVPVRVRDLGVVQSGTDFRRGALDLNGSEAVGGIVVMRFGENPLEVIKRVKEKISQLEPSLGGVQIEGIYDRTGLIYETIATLTGALLDEILVTLVVVALFLMHLRSSLIVAATLPLAVLMSFMAMRIFGLDANIMSLAGIAIAIGNMVDMGIVVAENIYEKLARFHEQNEFVDEESRGSTIVSAVSEVVPALMTAMSTTIISFLPVFLLTGRDFKLFAPLAWTKTYALVSALICAIVVVPYLCRLFLRPASANSRGPLAAVLGAIVGLTMVWGIWLSGDSPLWSQILASLTGAFAGGFIGWRTSKEKMPSSSENPVAIKIIGYYEPLLRKILVNPGKFLRIPVAVFLAGLVCWLGLDVALRPMETAFQHATEIDLKKNSVYSSIRKGLSGLKSDDWIALDEGSFFYMPTLYPAASFSQALEVLQTQDTLIKRIPEVDQVLGKIGRAESALDPAPAAMVETYVTLKPKDQWRENVTSDQIWQEINDVATLPGVTPASYLQPIEGRVVMLQSGIKASMAVRIFGDDLEQLASAAKTVAEYMKQLPVIHEGTVNPDIVLGKPYAEFTIDRQTSARFGLSVSELNAIIETAVGGKVVGHTVEGRDRYPIRVRYLRQLRERVEDLERLPVITPKGEVIPLGVLAKLNTSWGPAVISSEDARLVAHVSFSPSGVAGDLETVNELMQELQDAQDQGRLQLPEGYELQPVGSFQNQIEANRRLVFLIPLVIFINLFIIYLQFKKFSISLIVFSGIPLAFGGGMILLKLLGLEVNTAVWVGFIALFGISVDNGVLLATYLETQFKNNLPKNKEDLIERIILACKRRVRPCLMTTTTTLIALTPILLADGRGSDVAKAMAFPVFGGMLFALLELGIVPALYFLVENKKLNHQTPTK